MASSSLVLPASPSFAFGSSNGNGGIVLISGGTAANSLVDIFKGLSSRHAKPVPLSFVIAITDNGGSTSEIIRVLGGPGIGDIRSRLIRLVPDDGGDPERRAIKRLLNLRLPSSQDQARNAWNDIVEGTHEYWRGISGEKREVLRSFLITVNSEITKRARPSSSFNFQLASLGNLFLTGCRLFFGSLESAIFLFKQITSAPAHIHVLPALNSNFTHHIAAGLGNGIVIAGQNQISHPSEDAPAAPAPGSLTPASSFPTGPISRAITPDPFRFAASQQLLTDGAVTVPCHDDDEDDVEDANLPGSLPALRKSGIIFAKDTEAELSARIERLWYINPYGQEIRPSANPKVISAIRDAETLVYSIGSLFTSIIPCLILRGVGDAIAHSPLKYKILLLNGSHDREVGPGTDYTAFDFIRAITRACMESRGVPTFLPSGEPREISESEYGRYVSHVVYLEGEGVPKVDKAQLKGMGIESFKAHGSPDPSGKGMLYDGPALQQTLEMIMGRTVRQRRQTVDLGK